MTLKVGGLEDEQPVSRRSAAARSGIGWSRMEIIAGEGTTPDGSGREPAGLPVLLVSGPDGDEVGEVVLVDECECGGEFLGV